MKSRILEKKKQIAIISTIIIAITISSVYSVDLVPKAEGQIVVDAMSEITTQIQSNLATSMPADVQRENIRQVEHLVFGKPVILDTPTTPQTLVISDNYDTMVSMLKSALIQCSQGSCSDSVVASEAKELADRITYWQETKMNLEFQTNITTCNVNNPTTCTQLNLGDEPNIAGTSTTVAHDLIWDGWHREIRSPYFQYAPYITPQENIIVPSAIANGECAVVIKEIQGIKSIVRPTVIPIWQEPWTSRATIIGYNAIWVVDFVPAEFVKNLNYCNINGQISFDYNINVIVERQLTHFWKFLPIGTP